MQPACPLERREPAIRVAPGPRGRGSPGSPAGRRCWSASRRRVISAESGTAVRCGVALLGDLVARVQSSRRRRGRGGPSPWIPDVRRPGPAGRRHVVDQVPEPWPPSRPCRTRRAGRRSPRAARAAPRRRGPRTRARAGQRALRPVDGRVLLAHGGPMITSTRVASPTRGSRAGGPPARCRTAGRQQADLAQAGEVLARGVQDPLRAVERGACERGQVVVGDRVDQRRARALPAQLDQVGTVGVAVARRPLGVEGDRARCRRRPAATTSASWAGVSVIGAGRHAGSAAAAVPAPRPASGATGSTVRLRGAGPAFGTVRRIQPGPHCHTRAAAAACPPARAGADGRDKEVAPGLDVGGSGRRRETRRPGSRAGRWAAVGHPTEALRRCRTWRSPGAPRVGTSGLERLDQPAPADAGQHRVADQLGVDLRAGGRAAAAGAAPGVVAGRVVQHGPGDRRPTSSPSRVTSADGADANGAIRWGAGISSTKSSARNLAARSWATARGTREEPSVARAGVLGCRHVDRLGRPLRWGGPTRRLTCEDRPMPTASTTTPNCTNRPS